MKEYIIVDFRNIRGLRLDRLFRQVRGCKLLPVTFRLKGWKQTKGDSPMKFISKSLIAGALLMLMVPMVAQAQDCYFDRAYYSGWGHYDRVRDRRDLRRDWRDVARHHFQLRHDIAYGNWYAARAQRADIARDLADVHGDRWDLYRDYRGLPPHGYYFTTANQRFNNRVRPRPQGAPDLRGLLIGFSAVTPAEKTSSLFVSARNDNS